MKNSKTISKLFEELGCPLGNVRNHWSAGSPERQRIIFTVWDNEIDDERYVLVPEGAPPYMKKPGGVQMKKDAELGLMNGVETLGILLTRLTPQQRCGNESISTTSHC